MAPDLETLWTTHTTAHYKRQATLLLLGGEGLEVRPQLPGTVPLDYVDLLEAVHGQQIPAVAKALKPALRKYVREHVRQRASVALARECMAFLADDTSAWRYPPNLEALRQLAQRVRASVWQIQDVVHAANQQLAEQEHGAQS